MNQIIFNMLYNFIFNLITNRQMYLTVRFIIFLSYELNIIFNFYELLI